MEERVLVLNNTCRFQDFEHPQGHKLMRAVDQGISRPDTFKNGSNQVDGRCTESFVGLLTSAWAWAEACTGHEFELACLARLALMKVNHDKLSFRAEINVL